LPILAASKADLEAAKIGNAVGNDYTVSAGLNKTTASDVLNSLNTNDTVHATIANGFGAATDTAYAYNATNKSFSFDANAISSSSVQSYLTPKAGDTASLSVTVGTTSVDVVLSSDGKIAAKDGSALFIDTTGNLTQNNSGAVTAATLDALTKNHIDGGAAVETTITATDGAKFTLTGSADDGVTAGAINVEDAVMSASALQSAAKTTGFTVGAPGANEIQVSNAGAVTKGVGNDQLYTGTDGALTTNNTKHLFLQDDGSVTNGSGKAVYKNAEGAFTTDAATTSAATSDPLKALDDAIASVDKFRSSLGAVQNRLDSAVTNLNNTTTNLSEAQSRIQDADYATEVSNMSKAQIIQQAGNSVLSKANQVPQQILSLLQG